MNIIILSITEKNSIYKVLVEKDGEREMVFLPRHVISLGGIEYRLTQSGRQWLREHYKQNVEQKIHITEEGGLS